MPIEKEILDPILKKALAEIADVLERHQIGGAIAVASSTHGAFRVHFPEWSLVQIDQVTGRLDARLRKDEHARTESSIHMLFSLNDLCTVNAINIDLACGEMVNALREAGVEISHKAFGGPEPAATT